MSVPDPGLPAMFVLAFALAVGGCGGHAADAGARSATAPAAAPRTARADEDCRRLRDATTQFADDVAALAPSDDEGAQPVAPRFEKLGKLAARLDAALDVTFARDDVRSLASEYRAAARELQAKTPAAAKAAADLDTALAGAGTSAEAWRQSVQPVYDFCQAQAKPPADCRHAEDVLVKYTQAGVAPDPALLERLDQAYDALAHWKVTTPALTDKFAQMVAALRTLRAAFRTFADAEERARPSLEPLDAAIGRLGDLDDRRERLCPGAAAPNRDRDREHR